MSTESTSQQNKYVIPKELGRRWGTPPPSTEQKQFEDLSINPEVFFQEVISKSSLMHNSELNKEFKELSITPEQPLSEGGKINLAGRKVAEFIMNWEFATVLDLLFNAGPENPLSSQQRTALIHEYLLTVVTRLIPGRSELTDDEYKALTKSLRARNLFRTNRLRRNEESRFEAVEVTERFKSPEEVVKKYTRMAARVKNMFQGTEISETPSQEMLEKLAKEFMQTPEFALGELQGNLARIRNKAVLVSLLLIILCGVGIAAYRFNPSIINSLFAAVGGVKVAQAQDVDQNDMTELYNQLTTTPENRTVESVKDSPPKDDTAIVKEVGSDDIEKQTYTDAYSYMRATLETNLNSLEKNILDKKNHEGLTNKDEQLLSGIKHIRERLASTDEIIINIVITDRDGSEGDKAYFLPGQEHIGNSDGFMQLVINKGGLFLISFGRNLQIPRMIPQQNGTFSQGSWEEIHYLGAPLKTTEGHYMTTSDGMIKTDLDEGQQAAEFNAVTGQEALLNVHLSLGLLYKLADAAFPQGVTLDFPDGFKSKQVNYNPGETVHLSGRDIVDGFRQRPINDVDQGSYDRGRAFLRAIAKDPSNLVRLVQAIDLNGPFSVLASEDLGPSDGREFMVGTSAEDLATWQALRMALQDPKFATDISGLIMRWIVAKVAGGDRSIPMFTIQEPTGPDALADYRKQVQDIMKQNGDDSVK